MIGLTVLLVSASLIIPGSEVCSDLEAAHDAFLKSAFTAERHFKVVMNGKLKVREVARLNYSEGQLTTEIVEREILDKNIELDDSNSDLSLDISFDCERMTEIEAGQFMLISPDEKESVLFLWDRDRGVLQPLHWKSTEKTRFLWKKLEIVASAEYQDFEWQ